VRRSSCLLALVCALAGLALASGPAQAETTHPFLTSFDGSDTPSGSFRAAGRVGVDQSNGNVYVVDINVFAGTGAVEVFDESGAFLHEISGEDTPAGSFAFSRIGSSGVAAHDGEVYVADTRNNVVDVFDPSGAYVRQLTGIVAPTGVAVDAEGHVWVAESGSGDDTNGMVHEFDEAGTLVQSWPNGYFQTDAIALDSTGRVYLINGAGDVTRWTATGGDETLIADSATGIAIDPADDHIYVDKRNSVSEYDETGLLVVEFGAGRVFNSFGVAVQGGKVFVSNSIPPVHVNVFGPLATIPDVSVGAASAITTTSATVSGTINPAGIAATYQFEWGTDSDYGNVAPATPVDAGDGTVDVPATANLSGLTPGTTYHYRLKGTNPGGSNFSQDGSFTTLSPPAIVSTSGNGGVGSATLTALVNPRGFDTSYHFEYGVDDSYGSSTTETVLGGGFDDLNATATIGGLESGRTYQFRVVATNAGGTSTGDDATVRVRPAPSISGLSVSDVGHDRATLHAWINANGVATAYRFECGPSVAYGLVSPALPASIGSGSAVLPVSSTLTGLAPGTTYHQRTIATSAAGESVGPDQTFTTLPAPGPPAPSRSGSGSAAPLPLSPPKTPLQVASLTRTQLATWARTGRVTLRVTVGGAGLVTARARAKLPGQFEPSTVARASKTASAPGTVTLTLQLSPAARRALARKRLPVTVVVDGTGADRPLTERVTLRKRAR
jgi:hypothetical protein